MYLNTMCRESESNRHGVLTPLVFETSLSTNFSIAAYLEIALSQAPRNDKICFIILKKKGFS